MFPTISKLSGLFFSKTAPAETDYSEPAGVEEEDHKPSTTYLGYWEDTLVPWREKPILMIAGAPENDPNVSAEWNCIVCGCTVVPNVPIGDMHYAWNYFPLWDNFQQNILANDAIKSHEELYHPSEFFALPHVLNSKTKKGKVETIQPAEDLVKKCLRKGVEFVRVPMKNADMLRNPTYLLGIIQKRITAALFFLKKGSYDWGRDKTVVLYPLLDQSISQPATTPTLSATATIPKIKTKVVEKLTKGRGSKWLFPGMMQKVGPADDNTKKRKRDKEGERGKEKKQKREKKQRSRQNMIRVESYQGAAFLQLKLNAALFMKRFGNAIQLTFIDYKIDTQRFLDVCPSPRLRNMLDLLFVDLEFAKNASPFIHPSDFPAFPPNPMPELNKEISEYILDNADSVRDIDYIRRSQKATTEDFCLLEQEEAKAYQAILKKQQFGNQSLSGQEASAEEDMQVEEQSPTFE